MDAAILFEADAFRLDGAKLMGRQAAGNGFIRAAVAANTGGELWGFSPYGDASGVFKKTVAEIDPSVTTRWIGRQDFKQMADRRVLFRPDGMLLEMAAMRLRGGIGSHAICGITHTLSGPPLRDYARFSTAALAPWDALICTSRAAVSVIEDTFASEADYLSWRLGQKVEFPRPQLPVIPLGVHAADFADRPSKRAPARARLGLADDEVVALFAGRLTFHAKAHPYQMYASLQAAAERTGKKVVLIQAGQAPNAQVYDVLNKGMASFCPDVRSVYVDGKDFEAYAAAWSASDFFMSISDNIQETFGITPIEAMASGMPVVVSDWDGYRDTVRDGEDGFRIPSYAPAPGTGDHIATSYESGELNYDYMLFRTCMTVGVDFEILVDRVSALVDDAELRQRMGRAASERARTVYDWAAVYRRYRSMWDDLDAIRLAERGSSRWANAPRSLPGRDDPFTMFRAFPTHHIGPQTRMAALPGASAEAQLSIQATPLFEHWQVAPALVRAIHEMLPNQPTCAEIAAATQLAVPLACEVLSRMVKMGLARPV